LTVKQEEETSAIAEEVKKKKTTRAPAQQRSFLRRVLRARTARIGIGILVITAIIIAAGTLSHYAPNATSSAKNLAPSLKHPFGTDFFGHDLFSQIGWGAYPSFLVAGLASIGAVTIGLLAGAVSGYYNRLSGIVGGTGDIIMAFPAIVLLLVIGSVFVANDFLIAAILILVFWPVVSRVVRNQVLAVKQLPYVDAARGSGYRDWQILIRIMLPEVGPLGIAYFILTIPLAIILVTAIEFLGVGNVTTVSWGTTL